MLVYEFKLKVSKTQRAAIEDAIRTAQFIRNKCLRLWMDDRNISANDLQVSCARLAHEFAFAARLNSQARQASADRAWAAISRFYANCQAKRPGKKGYPRFQRDCRSVEYKQTGWNLEPDGKHLTFTDGCGIGRVTLLGTRDLTTFAPDQLKRVRLIRRADGYYAQVVILAERKIQHVPTGTAKGVDVGLAAYTTDSEGHTVENPKFLHHAEARLKRHQRVMARRSVHHKTGKKPKQNHAARRRAQQNTYPAVPQPATLTPPISPATVPAQPARQSQNWHAARARVGKDHLKIQRQREDFARKAASALTTSSDLVALEDLEIRNMVRNRHLSKAISDAGWGRYRHWVEYYGRIADVPVIAIPPHYSSQDCSGCGKRVWKSLSVRTHVCPHCGLILGRDHNSARLILEAGLALARARGLWPRNGTVGHTAT